MNEMMLSVDITPALAALRTGTACADTESTASALPQPSAAAVEAFQSAMTSLVSDNRSIQSRLEAIVARPLDVPARAPVAQETKPVVAAKPLVEVTPEIVKQFAETIAPLVAGNREVQVALETAVARPLSVPVSDETVRVQSPVVAPEIAPVGERPVAPVVERPVASEAKPVVAAKPLAEVTPEIVKQFAETIAPLVNENRKVQVALEKVVPLPLTLPEAKPAVTAEAEPTVAAKPLAEVTPEIVKQFAETIAPLVNENREVQVALEKVVPLPLTVPEVTPVVAKEMTPAAPTPVAETQPSEARQPVSATVRDAVVPEAKPVAAVKPLAELTPEIVKRFAETIAPLVAENREVQVALETAVVRPLTAPELKPATKTESANESAPLPSAGEDVVLQAVPVAQEAVADVVRPEAEQPVVAGIGVPRAAPKVAPTPAEVLIVAAEAVADTIMVTPGLLSGEGRIHVQLKPDVLGGTEIQLNVTGRTIAVEFQPQMVEMGALIQRCLPQLEQHLAAKIHSFTIAATVNQSRRRKV